LPVGVHAFGYGGWPLDAQGTLLRKMLALVREAIPAPYPLHALGVGEPDSVLECARMGYTLFDSALPTRDARNGRLYAFASDPQDPGFRLEGDWHHTVYLHDKKHIKAAMPLSPRCGCHTCSLYSTGYLHHLHRCNDTLYFRLATVHNLYFMSTLMRLIRMHG
jgi:queuine tRNA-ribosyltransferase